MAMIAVPISRDIARLFTQIDVPGEREPSDHITLSYLGDKLQTSTITKLMPLILEITSKTSPFLVTCKRITTFPKGDKGYPIIAQLQSEPLNNLREKIIRVMDRQGIEYSKKYPEFKPHVTLSFSKKKIKNIRFNKIQWLINSVSLYGGDETDEKIYCQFPFSLDIVSKKAAYIEALANEFRAKTG